jgi:hypothetical protein
MRICDRKGCVGAARSGLVWFWLVAQDTCHVPSYPLVHTHNSLLPTATATAVPLTFSAKLAENSRAAPCAFLVPRGEISSKREDLGLGNWELWDRAWAWKCAGFRAREREEKRWMVGGWGGFFLLCV